MGQYLFIILIFARLVDPYIIIPLKDIKVIRNRNIYDQINTEKLSNTAIITWIRNIIKSKIDHESTIKSSDLFFRPNEENLSRSRKSFKVLNRDLSRLEFKEWLKQQVRQGDYENEVANASITNIDNINSDDKHIIETEISDALSQNSSAINQRPYIEQLGLNDFIVMRPAAEDKFVTIIPNNIYYGIQKKCVNWLDNCSQKGIQDRLLRQISSP